MTRKKSWLLLKLLVVITFMAMIAVNALANILPINGITTVAVADYYPNLFTPAGLTLSIWGLIYMLLAAHTLYQLGLFHGKDEKMDCVSLHKIGILFSISSLVNAAWIFSWHYMIISLSMILMAILLICLITITLSINTQRLTSKEKFFIRLPFSVYFGWITVATIANAVMFLVSFGWNGFELSDSTWTIIVLVFGMIIGMTTTIWFNDIAYGLVLVWAYAGILIKHLSASGFSGKYPGVIITVSICIGASLKLMFSYGLIRKSHCLRNNCDIEKYN